MPIHIRRAIFKDDSGPFWLTRVDWSETQHRRIVAASLVQGVYNLELDRQRNNQGLQASTRRWWEFFGFELKQGLKDRCSSYFGAVFEYRSALSSDISPGKSPPRYVIAFRGTLIKLKTILRDVWSDVRILFLSLHEDSRSHVALQTALKFVDQAGPENVWLAGHSLGSAIALLVGRKMVAKGFHLQTYLFNLPFPNVPIAQMIIDEKTMDKLRTMVTNFVAHGIAAIAHPKLSPEAQKKNPLITVLSNWTPFLFLNPFDFICSDYIAYFKHRDKIAPIHSYVADKCARMGLEPMHVLPSGRLFINLSTAPGIKEAHGIKQWFKQDIRFEDKSY